MRFTPHYMVSYHGEYYPAGITFDIDTADAEEMSKHGVIKASAYVVEAEQFDGTDNSGNSVEVEQNVAVEEKPVARRAGRPRKS